jgi:hypothetical protein
MLLAVPGLFKVLWGEVIATSIYLTNRSLIKVLPKGKTPYEMLYGIVPRYKHIKTFGCVAYALKPHAKDEGKLALRSEKQWLLEYEATTIFRLWNSVKKIVRTSRDVNFNKAELIFAKCIANPTISPTTTSPITESNAESNAESDTESDTDLNAESSIESIDQPTFRPTTRSMTRKSTL